MAHPLMPADSRPRAGAWPLRRLRERREFLRVAASRRRWVTPAFIVQARPAGDEPGADVGVGYTVSKKVGNAVIRNLVRRRLREVVRLTLAPLAQKGWEYVLVGRAGSEAIPVERLARDLKWALGKLHAGADMKKKPSGRAAHGAKDSLQKDKP